VRCLSFCREQKTCHWPERSPTSRRSPDHRSTRRLRFDRHRTGVLVAVTGGIGFVGLMVPHFVRLIVGADHWRLLPAAALSGALFLIWADVLARTVVAPEELPIGIVTAIAGAPFFLWILRSRGQRRWVS
jgi:FecCD transport family